MFVWVICVLVLCFVSSLLMGLSFGFDLSFLFSDHRLRWFGVPTGLHLWACVLCVGFQFCFVELLYCACWLLISWVFCWVFGFAVVMIYLLCLFRFVVLLFMLVWGWLWVGDCCLLLIIWFISYLIVNGLCSFLSLFEITIIVWWQLCLAFDLYSC